MQSALKYVFNTVVTLIVIFYATVIGLSYANPTQQQNEIIKSLVNTASNGAEKIFELMPGDLHFK
jgi:hypothetical protein